MDGADRYLGLDQPITRRDCLNGVALGLGGSLASTWLTACGRSVEPAALVAQGHPTSYPPALTGMRGSHDGAWELAHALRDGTFWQQVDTVTDLREVYDLVVVGCGISGLAAAYFFRQHAGNDARILLLDNHDDFGGHATRNEFRVDGQLLLGNGGTQAIATPTPYSPQARGLLTALGIDPPALTAQGVDRQLFAALKPAVFFDHQTFGEDRLVIRDPARPWADFLARTPLSPTGPARYRAPPGRAHRLSAGAVVSCQEGPPVAHELPGLPPADRPGASRCHTVLPDAHARALRGRD